MPGLGMLPLSAMVLCHLRGNGGLGSGLRILSWNVATLFYHITANPAAASMKMQELKRLCRLHHIVCLQELHGVYEDKITLDRELPEHQAFFSAGHSPGVGGVAIIVTTRILAAFEVVYPEVVIEGRALSSSPSRSCWPSLYSLSSC